jgi:hypothetical protein
MTHPVVGRTLRLGVKRDRLADALGPSFLPSDQSAHASRLPRGAARGLPYAADSTPAKFRSKSRRRPSGWPYAKKAAEAREEYEREAKRRLAYYTGGR